MKYLERHEKLKHRLRIGGIVAVLGAGAISGVAEAIVRFAEPESASEAHAMAVVATESPADSVVEATPAWDLPNLDHPRVDYWVERFTTDRREEFARYLSRSGRYAPMISAKLAERGMPQDLLYLAMIESGFNPKAYSRAHASGLWQFISGTAARYGLEINNAVDERNDPEKATDAALEYLSYLHNRFGSWYLAAAGYNTGENRVGRIMRTVTGSERGQETDYYRIWSRLPRETRDYVPLMVAAARISKEPARYGFGDVVIEAPVEYDEVVVDAATPLPSIAQAAGTTIDEIRALNPHLKLNRTRNDMRTAVRVPSGGAQQFAANWHRVRQQNATYAQASAPTSGRTYRIRRGDNLTKVARNHGVTVRALRRANGLRGDRIIAGRTLRIPA